MPNSQITKASIRQLIIAYASAVTIILLLLISAQVLVQYTLHREVISRQASSILASNTVAEQHLQRNDVLLIVPGDHRSIAREMASDLATVERNHALFQRDYASLYPDIVHLKTTNPSPYAEVDSTARALITVEMQHPSMTLAQRKAWEYPLITRLFYASDAHLALVVQSEHIVDVDTDGYINDVQFIEMTLFGLTLLTITAEALLVVRPAIRQLQQHFALLAIQMEKEKEAAAGK